jgi:hypothetical protein
MSVGASLRGLTVGARRKLVRSFDRRGVLGTMAHATVWPARQAARVLSPEFRAARREDRAFDRAHGVDTSRDFDATWTSSFDGWTWRDAIGYNPVSAEAFRRALDAVNFEAGRAVFVDFGAGKGRAMLLATHYPFRRVLGVELAPRLQRIAAENLARYRAPERICGDAEIALGDALGYPIPEDPAVFFFYDPFGPLVFAPVIERIRRSLVERPRRAWIVYRDPRCGDLVEAAGFRRIAVGDERTGVYAWPGGQSA